MPDAKSEVQIVISGSAVGLQDALKQAQAGLAALGGSATKAGAEAGAHLAAGEHKAASEATILGERARVAAEMVGLLGAESSEQILKIEGLNHAFGEAQHAFGSFGGALAATAGSFALFKGLDFMKESVDEAEQGEASWARLTAAYKDNAQGLEQVKGAIEEQQPTWEKLGLTQAQVAEMAAKAAGMGLDPTKLLGDPAALADTAKVLGTDIPTALADIARPRGAQQVLSRLGLSPVQIKEAMARMRDMNAQQRALFIAQQVEQSRFAGQGLAAAGTTQGKFLAFHTAMADLREEVGNALLPALTELATALTTMLGAVEAATKPWGGLANVLKTLFLPMLGLGLLLFTNLRGMMTGLVNLLLGRLVGSFAQTAESMTEADSEARTLASDVEAIPETWTTTAIFLPATAVKDAYRANIYSIPTEVRTAAIFEPADVPAETAGAAIPVPIVAKNELSAAEVTDEAKAAEGAKVLVPVVATGDLAGAVKKDVAAAQTYAKAHHVKVFVDAVKSGASWGAMGLAFSVASMVVDSKVTYVQDKSPKPASGHTTTPTPTATGTVTVGNATLVGQAIDAAMVGGKAIPVSTTTPGQPPGTPPQLPKGTVHVAVVGTPTVRISSATPLPATLTGPGGTSALRVQAQQSGHWTVDVGKFDLAAVFEMFAVGLAVSLASSLMGKLLPLFGGAWKRVLAMGEEETPGGPTTGGGAAQSEAQQAKGLMKDFLAQEEAGGKTATQPKSTFMLTGLGNLGSAVGDAIKHIDWLGAFKAAGMAAAFAAGLVAMVASAALVLGGALKGLFSPSEASAETVAEAKKAGLSDTQAKAYVQNSNKAILAAHEGMASSLGDLGGFIVDAIIDGVKHHWPSILPWLFGGERPKHGALYIGEHNYPEFVKAGSKVPGAPSGYQYVPTGKTDYPYRLEELIKGTPSPIPSSFSGRFGGLSRLDPALLTQASALIGASGAGGKAPAAAHHTFNATFHINGAQNPQAIARQIERALSDFMAGVGSQRRL